MSADALRVDGLSMDYGGVQAIQNISFNVEAGEKLAIIGPNGAGKTTLFNALNGQISPTAGRTYLFGQDITKMSIHRRVHLGMARSFQVSSAFFGLTVLENALLANQGTRRSRFQMFRPMSSYKDVFAAVQELLEPWDLWELRDKRVRELAYGEQRKLELSLSLASNPKLLLLDEPSAGLTSTESADIVTMLQALGKEITVLVVAHDMDLIFGVAERIMVLHHGEIIADGLPQEIEKHPKVQEIYMGIPNAASD